MLNVFKPFYYSRRHPSNWFSNIKIFFRQFKYAWQRATRGYCDADLWDLDDYYTKLFCATLKDFSKNLDSVPSNFYNEIDGMEKWREYLNEMITHLQNSLEPERVQQNEYEEAHSLDPNNEELSNKYIERTREIHDWQTNELMEGLNMLIEVYEDLWD